MGYSNRMSEKKTGFILQFSLICRQPRQKSKFTWYLRISLTMTMRSTSAHLRKLELKIPLLCFVVKLYLDISVHGTNVVCSFSSADIKLTLYLVHALFKMCLCKGEIVW